MVMFVEDEKYEILKLLMDLSKKVCKLMLCEVKKFDFVKVVEVVLDCIF